MSMKKKVEALDDFHRVWDWDSGLAVIGTHDPVDAFYEFVEHVRRNWELATHSQAQRDVQTAWGLSLEDFISSGHREYVRFADVVTDEEKDLEFHERWAFGRAKIFYINW